MAPVASLGGPIPACARDATVRCAIGSACCLSFDSAVTSHATMIWYAASTLAWALPQYSQPLLLVRMICNSGSVKLVWALSSGVSSTGLGAFPRRGLPSRWRSASTSVRRWRSASASAFARASRRRIAASIVAKRSSRRANSAGNSSPRRLPSAASSAASCWCACVTRDPQHLHKHIAEGVQMQLTKIADGPEVRALCAHNGDERQVPFAGLGDLSAGKHPHAVGIQQQAHHHGWVKRGGTTTFILIGRIETAQIQLGHRIHHEENYIAFGQLGVGAMSLIPVALGLPGPIRFLVRLAHQWSPRVGVTKGLIAGGSHYRPSLDSRQLSTGILALFRTGS